MSKIKSDYYVWIYVMVMCFVLILCVSNKTCLAKSKSVKCDTKLLNLKIGKSYNIKYKRGCKYTSSRPKIASVSKKGKIKAHKSGKCVIKVLKKKKCIAKYKVRVYTEINNSGDNLNTNQDNIAVDNSQVNLSQDNKKVDIVPGRYPENFISGQSITTLEKIVPIDDSSFYLYFNLDEWYDGYGKPAGYKFLKIRIDKTKDKEWCKDIEYCVGNKYGIYIIGNYMIDGECIAYSDECGALGIGVAKND